MKRSRFISSSALALVSTALPLAAFQTGCSSDKKTGSYGDEYHIGNFILRKSSQKGLLIITSDETKRILWESPVAFLIAEKADADIKQYGTPDGFFKITDNNIVRFENPVIDSVEVSDATGTVKGTLTGKPGKINFIIIFTSLSPEQLKFEISTDDPQINRILLRSVSTHDEAFFGFGQQMTYFNQKGNLIPVIVQEHGVGRGRPVVTQLVDIFAKGGGGDPYISEAPVPFFISSKLRSMFLENTEYSLFDMRPSDHFEVKLWSGKMTGRILNGFTPAEIIKTFTEYSGRMRALPDWIHNGVIACVQGGMNEVNDKYSKLKNAGVPVAGLWIQDWCGVRVTSVGKQLWWDWKIDETYYPDWDKLLAELDSNGVKVLTYMNPFLSNNPGHDELFNEAKSKDYLVKKNDGTPYLIKNSDFYAGLIDLSNPETRTWIKNIIKEQMIKKAGAYGWMTDFAEAMPFDVKLKENIDPNAWHNIYCMEWAKVHREAIDEAGLGNEIVFFNRSGFTQSPKYSTLFWLGDQLQSWDEYDGIKSAVVGMLSGGVSGYSLLHSDSGGFTTMAYKFDGHTIPVIARSGELFKRWLELGALSCVFRTHEGLDPGISAQFYSTPEDLEQLKLCANIYKGLTSYRKRLVLEASQNGIPVARHLFLHYPEDTTTYSLRYQYLLGPDILFAPVVDKGATEVDVYFPKNSEWIDLWTGNDAGRNGEWRRMSAPISRPAVFLRKGSDSVNEIIRGLKDVGVLFPLEN